MSAAYAYARPAYPVAQGADGTIYHRYNYSYGRDGTAEVLTLEGWKPEASADYSRHIPITKVPDCSAVLAHPQNNSQRAANDAIFAELADIRQTIAKTAQETIQPAPKTGKSFNVAAPPETLAQQSARLDTFVERDNASRAQQRSTAESYLREHFKPAGPWVADRIWGKQAQPEQGL